MQELFIQPAPIFYKQTYQCAIDISVDELIDTLCDVENLDFNYFEVKEYTAYQCRRQLEIYVRKIRRRMRQDFPGIAENLNPVCCAYLDDFKTEYLLWTPGFISDSHSVSFMLLRKIKLTQYTVSKL